jgi:hypothetical protein
MGVDGVFIAERCWYFCGNGRQYRVFLEWCEYVYNIRVCWNVVKICALCGRKTNRMCYR